MMLLLIFLLYAILLSIGLGLAGYRSAPAAPQPEPGEPPTRILVIGATGGTGGELVSQALAGGMQVTALVRTPARLTIEHPQLRVLRGRPASAVPGQVWGRQPALVPRPAVMPQEPSRRPRAAPRPSVWRRRLPSA